MKLYTHKTNYLNIQTIWLVVFSSVLFRNSIPFSSVHSSTIVLRGCQSRLPWRDKS